MLSAIKAYTPETWDGSSQETVKLSKFTAEYRQVEYELRQAFAECPSASSIIRVQNIHDYGQFLIREQLLVAESSTQYYRVRRYIQISGTYLNEVSKYNLDPRRCGLGSSLTFRKTLTNLDINKLICVVVVLTTVPHHFLRKEEEFRKENKQLEQRTKEILQKVDDIMVKKLQDFQFEDTFKFKQEAKHIPDRIDAKDLNLPKSVDEMGTRGMVHFYKAKIKTLQGDLEKLQNELKSKSEELKKSQKNHQIAAEEKEKWFLQCNLEKNCNAKLEKQIAACNAKLQVKDNENLALKKENDQLKNDLKNSCGELSATETRLKRACLEVEKHKTMLKALRQEQKETKESYTHNLKDLTVTVKQIQKHKNELLQGYKKQIQLIDNLKKQKAHVESCKVLELAENEFFKLLDWKLE
ncbi:uncharacterized protein BDFB_004783 [Asbolus verrucosus]|uniref:Uncharacterized protein n=1 Tax=Asbolus verrucosus TaxID=1661398 RepID=A0A482V7X6_ASBVE|nr:uncharacterized protein BDFB_004783 [Asbolus verrucosus]